MKDLVIGGGIAAVVILWWIVSRSKQSAGLPACFTLPSKSSVKPRPFLTEAESAFYNRLYLAVQERYLIVAHVPLSSFMSVEAPGKERFRILKHLVLARADFALVHPGSRLVELVVLLQTEPLDAVQRSREQVVESVAAAAGIKLVKARSAKSYTIPELVDLLGISDNEAPP
ncbi:MAG: DUF2726 domain-containing protein [Nitrospira sp.]|nr:DUF2726 domain-containing protein [Nitrospira sp.]